MPFYDVFYVAVVAPRGKPYTISLRGTQPDADLARFAEWVGYRRHADAGYDITTCWLEPGVKLRRTYPKGVEEISLGRAGKEYARYKVNGGEWQAAEREVAIADGKATYTWTLPQPKTVVADLVVEQPTEDDIYDGYLCNG